MLTSLEVARAFLAFARLATALTDLLLVTGDLLVEPHASPHVGHGIRPAVHARDARAPGMVFPPNAQHLLGATHDSPPLGSRAHRFSVSRSSELVKRDISHRAI